MRRSLLVGLVATLLPVTALAQAPPPPPPPLGMQGRDNAPAKTGTATLSGRVLSAETGAPLRRAQVRAASPELREGRSVSTNAEGRWEMKNMPAGRYTITVTKGGYVQMAYGQLRPFEQGKQVDVADGQVVEKLDTSLPKGSVIAGRIRDEYGEPVAGVRVAAMRYRFMSGQRRLFPVAGMGSSATTDDLGQYRLHGLSPGAYYVTAGAGLNVSFDRSDDRTGYAPTYYPGTLILGEAQRVTLAQSQEQSNVSFDLIPTRVATLSGTATGASGKPLANSIVMLASPNLAGGSPIAGTTMTKPDGSFAISNVAPGEYRLEVQSIANLEQIAMSGGTSGISVSESVSLPLTVTGPDISGIELIATPTASVSGVAKFEGGTPPTGLSPGSIAIAAQGDVMSPQSMMGAVARLKDDWTFELRGLTGKRTIRAMVQQAGWSLKSITLNNTDITDTAVEFAPGESGSGLEIVFSNKMAALSGTVQAARNQTTSDYVVIAFAADSAKWGYLSRFIRSARPDQSGKFTLNGLAAGDYLVAAVDYLEPGEEQDPEVLERYRSAATPVSLEDGEQKTLTLKLTRSGS